jgi:pyrroloquinoline quinone biosynthesis protein B
MQTGIVHDSGIGVRLAGIFLGIRSDPDREDRLRKRASIRGAMQATILGSGAGGAFPQWNCGCPNCTAVREGKGGYLPRTQDSVAVTDDGERHVLFNASPDILAQIQRTRALWPRSSRHSPIAAIVLTNGDMDHVLGLFSLRESQPFDLYATDAVWRGLEQSIFIRTLRRFEGHVNKRVLRLGEEISIAGLRVRASAAPGKAPVHLVGHAEPSLEDNVILVVASERGGSSIAYATACSTADVAVDGHAAVLFDGTFYREDELVRLGLSKAVAKDMAHVPISGENGSLTRLSRLSGRKIYTHINNTNPILAPHSDERRTVEGAGWEVAFDGMEIST